MQHIPSQCPICSGEVTMGKTTFSLDLQTGVVIVRNVPALICEQCGEEWIEDSTAAHLEKITDKARSEKLQLEMVSMS